MVRVTVPGSVSGRRSATITAPALVVNGPWIGSSSTARTTELSMSAGMPTTASPNLLTPTLALDADSDERCL